MSYLAAFFATLPAAPAPVTPPVGSAYRADTLAYQSYVEARGFTRLNLPLIDALHAQMEATGWPSVQMRSDVHLSCVEFGVKLGPGGRAQQVGCLYYNFAQELTAGGGPLFVENGWRGRNQLYYHNSALAVTAFQAGTTAFSLAIIGDPGTPSPQGASVLAELSEDYNNVNAVAMFAATELQITTHVGAYQVVSEGTPYAAGARYIRGTFDSARPAATELQFFTNRAQRTGRVSNLIQENTGLLANNNLYLGARAGNNFFLQQATMNVTHAANFELNAAQIGVLDTLAAYYSL